MPTASRTRRGGLLLHPTSLPGPFGIGDIGPGAREFVDWLAEAGCTLWQILPLCPTGFGNSPYQCHSVFAGNEYLLSPELMLEDGLLTRADLRKSGARSALGAHSASQVDFPHAVSSKLFLVERAFERFESSASTAQHEVFENFRAQNASWLDDYALYAAVKAKQGGAAWTEWPGPISRRERSALDVERQLLNRSVRRYAFGQMLFFSQWAALRDHAQRRAVHIVGDIPIFSAEDSADVWAHPELYWLNGQRRSSIVAGVPPDYFAPTGQLWGNPLYRWSHHKATGYAWWLQRLTAVLRRVDFVRLDHFRGFCAYWAIPATAATAEQGQWMPGPADDFLDAVMQQVGDVPSRERQPFIAEDLGVVTPEVIHLRNRYEFPGMKVLQFGFAGLDEDFLPHTYPEDCVAYTGTHDNDTARGWFLDAPDRQKVRALKYLRTTEVRVVQDMLEAVWASNARFAIAPVQDVLDLGSEARMNYPGRPRGNWGWRLVAGQLTENVGRRLLHANQASGRTTTRPAVHTRLLRTRPKS